MNTVYDQVQGATGREFVLPRGDEIFAQQPDSSPCTTAEDFERLLADSKCILAGEDVSSDAGDWPEPETLRDELPAVPPFDPALLPTSLRPMVEDVADRMQVAVDFPAIVAVTTLAGICSRRALMQPKAQDHSWLVVPNLWGAIVAPPGAMKSHQ